MQLTRRRVRGYDVRTRTRIAGLGQDEFVGPPVIVPQDFVGPLAPGESYGIPETGPIVTLQTPEDYARFFTGSPAQIPAPEPSILEQAGAVLRNIVQPLATVGAQYATTRAQIDATRGRSPLLPTSYSSSPFGTPVTRSAAPTTMSPMLILGIGATVLLITALMTRRK